MWQTPKQTAKGSNRKKERPGQGIHIRRIMAQVQVGAGEESFDPMKAMEARVVLNDLSSTGASFFSPTPMLTDQEVKMKLFGQTEIVVTGRIVWNEDYNANSHVISELSFRYRAGLEFLIKDEAEAKAIAAFVDALLKG